MSDKQHLYLVDGSAYIFRAYHRLPPLTNPHGTPVGASSEHSIADALRQWVDARPRSVRVAFPAPGDPLGLYGVGAFTSSAIVAQCAVVMDGGTRLGLVPEPDLRGSS